MPKQEAAPAQAAQPAATQAGQPVDPSVAEILYFVSDKKLSTAIPIKVEPYYFPSPDGNVYLPIRLQIDLSSLPAAAGPRPIHIFGGFFEAGALTRAFVVSNSAASLIVNLTKAEVVKPVASELYVGVRDDASGAYGLVQVALQPPDFAQFSMSSILFSKADPKQVQPPADLLNIATEPLLIGPYEFEPYFALTMKLTDPLSVFYFVMKPGADATGAPKLNVNYTVSSGAKELKEVQARRLEFDGGC